jgi:hypothetical protein
MPLPLLEDVFKISGVPTYTFVEPKEYKALILSLRTAGRGVVVEGPSGIGKTTAIEVAIKNLGIDQRVTKFSARKKEDLEYIEALPTIRDAGIVIVDDFHKLPDHIKTSVADYMKTLADEEAKDVKLIVIGINRAGENLINFAHDLVNRIDIIPFESNPDNKVKQLIEKGEHALNITLNVKDEIVSSAQGGFYLAQMLCREICLQSEILEASEAKKTIEISFEAVKSGVWDRLSLSFKPRCERFCRGTKLRKEGRAPYLHILNWLAQSGNWTLPLRDAIRFHPELRGSVSQVVEKDFLKSLIENDDEIRAVLHFDHNSDQLTIEDPQFLFYIRNIPWRNFSKEIGFISVDFDSRYDFALSFAGTDRNIAEALFASLIEKEVEVFYDRNEQHRILAMDVEEYLRPIYQSEARFVIVLLGPDYPKRIWTKIESDAFKERLGKDSVIPIWFSNAPLGIFDETKRIGGIEFDPSIPMQPQIENIVDTVIKKLIDSDR